MKIRHLLTRIGEQTANPWAFALVILFGAAWWFERPATFDWSAVATLAVWLMTLFIQRAQSRDNLALQAKLDELIKVTAGAHDELAHIDENELEDIQAHRRKDQGEV